MKTTGETLALLTDFYELTMGRGYFSSEMRDAIAYFDVFFRQNPDNGGYSIAVGLEQIIEYIKELHFDDSDIEYLRSKKIFDEDFLRYLRTFRFTGDIWAVPEGTVVFPNEPILTVKAPIVQAQLIETYILLQINHQSLIATKASRICRAAQGRPVSEFGSRRAHGESAAVLGARASYIGGCAGTACAISDKLYGVPAGGTMAHSWVQSFDTEYEAFVTYCRLYPIAPVLLVDTYNVLKSGIPNAIRAIKDVLHPQGLRACGIRLDSGDITYLTRKARKMLDAAGLPECRIIVSNSLDERIIDEILREGACVDAFGVGERLITSSSTPVFGAVYKLVAIEKNGTVIPKIKVSENIAKITNPGFKRVYRFYSNAEGGKAEADLITLADEIVPDGEPITLFDPDVTWKRKTFTDYTLRQLLIPIFVGGQQVYRLPPLQEIREHCAREIRSMWSEVLRFDNPHNYYVDLSLKLYGLKHSMIQEMRKEG